MALPSPTLTNPDMILPDSLPSPESSLSNPRQRQRPPSPPQIENSEYGRPRSALDEGSSIKDATCAMHDPSPNSTLRHHDGSTRLRSSSERRNNGIVLENNRLSYQTDGAIPFASSPTLLDDPKDYQQRIYTESTQGDYNNGEGTYSTPAILEEDENDPNSHAAMTKRAEEILAIAKKRLNVSTDVSDAVSMLISLQNMEGNLSRARSTLQARPSSSMSSFANRGPEPVSLYTIPNKGRNPSEYTPAKHRQANIPILDESKQGHLRVFSETSVPSSLQTGLPNGYSTEGAAEGADVQERHSEPNRVWFWTGLTRNTSLNHTNRHARGLQALNEDGPAPQSFEPQAIREEANEEEGEAVDMQSPNVADFHAQYSLPATGLTRARSTAQMQDIREQMQDLKGKISTLKQRAREDKMRRRSEQSLRTPSPFTAATEWYTEGALSEGTQRETHHIEVKKDDKPLHLVKTLERDVQDDSSHIHSTHNHIPALESKKPLLDERQLEKVIQPNSTTLLDHSQAETGIVDGVPGQRDRLILVDEPSGTRNNGIDGDQLSVEEPLVEDLETREDSLYGDQDYHETSTSPIVDRHEDRPDAFDYEHFVLNSAFGTYSGIGVRRSSSRRKRADSQTSGSSVETTKPRNSTSDVQQEDTLANGNHARQNSIDSVSTDNTFATADEGRESDENPDDWTFGQTMAGSRQPDNIRRHIPKGSIESTKDGARTKLSHTNGIVKRAASVQKNQINGVTYKVSSNENGIPPQAPPDLLTVLSATRSWQEGAPPARLDLGDRDAELVERLVKSLAKVCSEVRTSGPDGSKYEARVFRRKLDAARRVLDGEMNGEAF